MHICKTKEVITTSGNLAAILDFWHTSTTHEIGNATTRKLDPENSDSRWNFDAMCHSFGDITWRLKLQDWTMTDD